VYTRLRGLVTAYSCMRAEADAWISSSERCESSAKEFGELNGGCCPRVADIVEGCVRFLFLTVCQE